MAECHLITDVILREQFFAQEVVPQPWPLMKSGAEIALSRHARELQIDARVQPFAEANRKFEGSIIGSQDDDIARRIQNGGADLAVIQVLLYRIARFVRQRSIQIL
jgi:hypothetical protein